MPALAPVDNPPLPELASKDEETLAGVVDADVESGDVDEVGDSNSEAVTLKQGEFVSKSSAATNVISAQAKND